MAKEQIVLPGTIVKKSNVLCRARWAVESVFEPRLVALVAARVNKNDEDFQTYEIPVRELTGLTNDGGEAYRTIKEVTESLMSRVIKIQAEGSRSFALYNVFSRCVYNDDTKTISARFDPDLKPHYLGLKQKFTEYNLLEYLTLPSIYSQRIFEILKSWTDQSEVTIPLVDLYEMLNAPKTLRFNFKDFRRRVLEKAHKDINNKTSLRFIWEPVKKSTAVNAAVTAVTFKFNPKSQSSKPQTQTAEVVEDTTARGTVDAHAIECELRSQGVHKKTAADYAARADQAGKASAILNRLPSIIERAAGQPTAGRQRYILGAIQKELQQQPQIDVPTTPLNLETEARKCWEEKRTSKIVCPIRKYQEAGGRTRCEICLQTSPVDTSGA
jgi:plasmid replication initiation protein